MALDKLILDEHKRKLQILLIIHRSLYLFICVYVCFYFFCQFFSFFPYRFVY